MLCLVNCNRWLGLSLCGLFLSSATLAGEVQLSWSPSGDSSGYKVYRGTSSGGYSSVLDVGNTTTSTVNNLTDCMMWYFATSAYNTAGESGLSAEVSSWPRPAAVSASPDELAMGAQANIVIAGTNFRDGDTISFSKPGIVLESISIDSCFALTLNVSVTSEAPIGPVDVLITHPSGVAGTTLGLFAVTAPAAGTPLPPSGLIVH